MRNAPVKLLSLFESVMTVRCSKGIIQYSFVWFLGVYLVSWSVVLGSFEAPASACHLYDLVYLHDALTQVVRFPSIVLGQELTNGLHH